MIVHLPSLCLLALAIEQQSIPAELELGLSAVSTVRIALECDITHTPAIPAAELLARWELGTRALHGRAQSYAIEGERFRFTEHATRDGQAAEESLLTRHCGFDGAEIRYGSGDSISSIHTIVSLRQELGPAERLFFPLYFEALRIAVPCQPAQIGSLPRSEVLAALYAGASLRLVDQPSGPAWLVTETAGNHELCSWLDPERNFAVTRWEKRRAGQLVQTVRNSDFVRCGVVFLPRRVRVEYHGWYTRPDDLAAEPLMTRSIRVRKLDTDVPDATVRARPPQPGSVVIDGRFDGYDLGRRGHVTYHAAVPADQLLRSFTGADSEDQSSTGQNVTLLPWIALHGCGLLLWWGLLGMISRRRSSGLGRGVIGCLALAGTSADVDAQGLTRSELTSFVESIYKSIDTLQVSFSYPEAGSHGHHVHAELSFLGGQHMVVDGGHGWDFAPWHEFYSRSRSYVRGRQYEVDWPNKLAFETRELRPDEQIERFSVQGWLRASGYWPDQACLPQPEMFGVPLSLLTAVRDPRYRLEPGTQLCQGQPCVVLAREGKDRIWLDPGQGYAIRARRWFMTGKTAMDVEVEQLQEFAGRVFLPRSYRIKVYLRGDGQPLAKPTEFLSTVHNTRLNCLRPEDFTLQLRPGALRFNRREPSKAAQEIPGGLDFLVTAAEIERARYVQRYPPRGPTWLWIQVLGIAVLILAFALPGLTQRSRGSRQPTRITT